MNTEVSAQLQALHEMTVKELRRRWAEVFGEEAPNGHKRYLIKRIAWRIQANAEGDISERARRRAQELADDADLRVKAPRKTKGTDAHQTACDEAPPARDPRLPMPGTMLTREYKGTKVQVKVREEGFEYRGEVYDSLTGAARAITGSHWNGFHFFKLGSKKEAQ